MDCVPPTSTIELRRLLHSCNRLADIKGQIFLRFKDEEGITWTFANSDEVWDLYTNEGLHPSRSIAEELRCDKEGRVIQCISPMSLYKESVKASKRSSSTSKDKRHKSGKSKKRKKHHTNGSSSSSSDSPSSSSDSSSESDSSSDSDDSSSDGDRHRKRSRSHKKTKKKAKKSKSQKKRNGKKKRRRSKGAEPVPTAEPIGPMLPPPDPEDETEDDAATSKKATRVMTKEEWEKRQTEIRRVYDPGSGRTRLIRGDGEILEEIVTQKRHKQINRQATKGDGVYYQAKAGLLK